MLSSGASACRRGSVMLLLMGAVHALVGAPGSEGYGSQLHEDEEALMPTVEEAEDAAAAWALRVAASSPDEQTAQLRGLLAGARRSTDRRSAQETDAIPSWKYNPSLVRGAVFTELATALVDANSACSDALATNAGAAGPCAYDCATLTQHFFDTEAAECFVVEDPQTASWPSELMSKRQSVLDWEQLLPATSALPAAFHVGGGAQCVNVTIQSRTIVAGAAAANASHVETRCLMPGHHTHVGPHTDPHTVEIVGYTNITVDPTQSDGTYSFVIGDCTDTIVRLTYTFFLLYH